MAPTPTPVVGLTRATEKMIPPGITTGAAYADLDSIGVGWAFPVPISGVLQTVEYWDLDDEGLQVDLLLFDEDPGLQTDNGAVTLLTNAIKGALCRAQFTSFIDFTNGQKSFASPAFAYVSPGRKWWAIVQARGALNIAASKMPLFRLTFLADE